MRRLYEAFNRGDTAAAYELIDPAIEYVNPANAVEPGTRQGLDSYDAAMGKVRAVFGQAQCEIEELVESDDVVGAEITFHAHGRGSGLETAQRQVHLWTFRDGRAVRFEWSNEPGTAREAISRRSA